MFMRTPRSFASRNARWCARASAARIEGELVLVIGKAGTPYQEATRWITSPPSPVQQEAPSATGCGA
jgi:hypothetical protein